MAGALLNEYIRTLEDVPTLTLAVDVLRAKGFYEAAGEIDKTITALTQS